MSPVAHSPNGDHQTYHAAIASALDEWLRMGVLDIKKLVLDNLNHPTADELAAASADSQDGSVAYTLDPARGIVTVAPAIPHTEESRAAAEEAANPSGGGPAPADVPPAGPSNEGDPAS